MEPPPQPAKQSPTSLGFKLLVGMALLVGGAAFTLMILLLALPARIYPVTETVLPGLRIKLPVGFKDRRAAEDYRNGSVVVRTLGDRIVVRLSWEPGKALEPSELRQLASVMGAA